MFKTMMMFKNFHYQNQLTIIQEKELAQSQTPQIPNYQAIFSQSIYTYQSLYASIDQDHYFNGPSQFLAEFTISNIFSQSEIRRTLSQISLRFHNCFCSLRQIQYDIQCSLNQLREVLEESRNPFQDFFQTQSLYEKTKYLSFENQKAVYESLKNQKTLDQTLEDQSPKFKKEISLINQNLIKQIQSRKRKIYWQQY
ncbi:unnamed protein product [Paramecium sonneborni]|uniref:Uncharacterized protein n=1 Tax=Paramecium sonneborni TaxID=65129 RepID=A0A8S1QJZ4_9CILI|nr:unnamed protein product [Paramecium sonneborni]